MAYSAGELAILIPIVLGSFATSVVTIITAMRARKDTKEISTLQKVTQTRLADVAESQAATHEQIAEVAVAQKEALQEIGTVHTAVNSKTDRMMTQIADLTAQVLELSKERARALGRQEEQRQPTTLPFPDAAAGPPDPEREP